MRCRTRSSSSAAARFRSAACLASVSSVRLRSETSRQDIAIPSPSFMILMSSARETRRPSYMSS